jgi:hypothetical protein
MLIVVSLKDLVILIRRVRVMVLSATFNNIAVIIVVVSFICGGTRSFREKKRRVIGTAKGEIRDIASDNFALQ